MLGVCPIKHLRTEAVRRGTYRIVSLLPSHSRPLAIPAMLVAAALAGCAMSGPDKPIPPAGPNDLVITSDDNGNLSRSGGTVADNKSIPVLVNDVPITGYDIAQRAKLMRLGGGKGDQKSAIEELINETLESLEAQRRGVTVPDAQVDFAFQSIAQRLKMTPQQFTQALSGQGVAADSLKKRLKVQIAWTQLVQARTQQKATVRGEDITQAVLQKGDPTAMKLTEYTLQQIIFVVPASSPGGLYDQRRREASAFAQRFTGCDNSLEQAKQLRGVVVKDIGRRDSTQLTGPQGEAVKKTPAGRVAPPNQTDQGIELIAVCATRDIQSTDAVRTEVTNDLYLKQAEGLGKDYLKELRDRAIIEYR
jgi:peptidyl-prolyl cis-trans isomerase SurA